MLPEISQEHPIITLNGARFVYIPDLSVYKSGGYDTGPCLVGLDRMPPHKTLPQSISSAKKIHPLGEVIEPGQWHEVRRRFGGTNTTIEREINNSQNVMTSAVLCYRGGKKEKDKFKGEDIWFYDQGRVLEHVETQDGHLVLDGKGIPTAKGEWKMRLPMSGKLIYLYPAVLFDELTNFLYGMWEATTHKAKRQIPALDSFLDLPDEDLTNRLLSVVCNSGGGAYRICGVDPLESENTIAAHPIVRGTLVHQLDDSGEAELLELLHRARDTTSAVEAFECKRRADKIMEGMLKLDVRQ